MVFLNTTCRKFIMLQRFIAFLLLLFLLPVFLFCVLCIILEDGQPVFFKQKRVGVNRSIFWIYKFRSMKRDTPNVATDKLVNPNQYILKIGHFLRKSSLDELPNLINIIRGEMVFVGPRPALYNQYDLLKLREEHGVDKLIPGITGWAQVNGRDEISDFDKVKYEEEYLDKKSFLFDLSIMIKTFTSVLKNKNIAH